MAQRGNISADQIRGIPAISGSLISGNLIKSDVDGHFVDAGVTTDTDGTLAANSDAKIATQKAVKTYVDAHAPTGGAPAWLNFTTPPSTGWSWENQGGSTVATGAGYPYFAIPATGLDTARAYYRAAPASPFSITAALRMLYYLGGGGPQCAAGLALGDGTKYLQFGVFAFEGQNTNPILRIERWSSISAGGTHYNQWGPMGTLGQLYSIDILWLRVTVDATNITWYVSIDNANWIQFDQRAVGDYLGTITRVGLLWYAHTAQHTALLSWA